MDFGRDLDFIAARLDEGIIDAFLAFQIAHADGAAERVAVAARRDAPDHLAVAQDRLVVEQQRLGLLHDDLDQAARQRLAALGFNRGAADEVDVLLPRDCEAETGLERRIARRDVVAPVAIAFLAAQRIERVVTGQLETQPLPRLLDQVEDVLHELGRDIQLPPQLAHIGDAEGVRLAVADLDLLRRAEGERVVGKIGGADLLQQLARARPHDRQHAEARGHVHGDDTRIGRQIVLDPGQVAHLAGRGGHRHKAVLGQARDGQIRFDTAAFVEKLGVDDLPYRHFHVVGRDALQLARRIRPLDHEFGEG